MSQRNRTRGTIGLALLVPCLISTGCCTSKPVGLAATTPATTESTETFTDEPVVTLRAVRAAIEVGMSRPLGPYVTNYELPAPEAYVLRHGPVVALEELKTQLASDDPHRRDNAYEIIAEIYFVYGIHVTEALQIAEHARDLERDPAVLRNANHFIEIGNRAAGLKRHPGTKP